jgi:hypothetical protein
MSYELAIFNGSRRMIPMTIDGVTLEQTRQGAPAKLTFTVVKDEYLSFPEGAVARLTVDGKIVFTGFIFEKSRNKDQHISCVAYDQLRYFKNKDTWKIKNLKASDFLRKVCEQFLLKAGDIEDTGFVIENLLCDNKTIFDAVQDCLDQTLVNTGRLFILYDDAGRICLKDAEKMKSDLLICDQTAQDFDYTSSIEEMYNAVKLIQKKSGSDVGQAFYKVDAASVNRYGALQYFDNSLDESANPEKIAAQILELNNRVRRKLTINGALGDTGIRGGSSVALDLALGDQTARLFAIVDSVTHTFKNDDHTMALQLSGKELR